MLLEMKTGNAAAWLERPGQMSVIPWSQQALEEMWRLEKAERIDRKHHSLSNPPLLIQFSG